MTWAFILQFTLRGGSTSRLEDGYIFEVAEIVIHPQYDPYNIENDAALLRTVEPLVGFFISPIALMPLNEDMPAGTRAVVSGWGLMVGTIIVFLKYNL